MRHSGPARILLLRATPEVCPVLALLQRQKEEDLKRAGVVPGDDHNPELTGTPGSAPGVTVDPLAPYQDEHLEETPDRKLTAQLSPRQAVLPPNLRSRRL